MQLKTAITIDATIEKVWQILTDFECYPTWNPFILKIEGPRVVGSYWQVEIAHSAKKSMVFKPLLVRYTEPREFRWIGALGARWLFSGEHYFMLESLEKNQTRLVHGEVFKGLLSPLFHLLSGKKTQQGFVAMNAALKKIAEAK